MSTHMAIKNGSGQPVAQSLLDRDKLLKSIFRISTFLSAPSNVDDILARVLDEVVETIGFDRGIIRLFDETRQYLETKVVKNYGDEEKKIAFTVALDIDQHVCISTTVAKTGQPMVIEDAATDPRITETDRMLTRIYHRGSMFCAPLKIEGETIGIIAAWCEKETKFFLEEINLFLAFAGQASIIIHAARLFATNEEKIRDLMILQEAVSEMNFLYVRDNSIRDILIRSALRITCADRVLLYFQDLVKDRFFLGDGKKVFYEGKEACEEHIRGSIIAEAIAANASVSRRGNDNTFSPVFKEYPSEVAIPLQIKGRFILVLYLARKEGAYSRDQINILDILVKNTAICYDNAMMHARLSQEAETLKTEVEKLKKREDRLRGFHDIIGESPQMMTLFRVIEDVARHNTNILIQGESGTGKELCAKSIHRHSDRSSRSFVELNCAAIPATLLESELFGFEAGAFTDAKKRKIGLLEYASGGTLLLDEVGEMPLQLQAKFLRMLEDGHIRRLGGTETIPVDVRFIFSTNRDLGKMAREGTFREDLYYRVSVVPITIPPLRERGDDIILLARYYVGVLNKKFGKSVRGFSPDAENVLKAYHWPGNVRELRNIIERMMIMQSVGDIIAPENIPAEIKGIPAQDEFRLLLDHVLLRLPLEGIDFTDVTEQITNDIKRKILMSAVEKCQGNKSKASKLLGISRYKFIREHNKLAKSPAS